MCILALAIDRIPISVFINPRQRKIRSCVFRGEGRDAHFIPALIFCVGDLFLPTSSRALIAIPFFSWRARGGGGGFRVKAYTPSSPSLFFEGGFLFFPGREMRSRTLTFFLKKKYFELVIYRISYCIPSRAFIASLAGGGEPRGKMGGERREKGELGKWLFFKKEKLGFF